MSLAAASPTRPLKWLYLLALAVLIWALAALPPVLQKSPGEFYLLRVSFATLFRLGLVFYGLFILPGLLGQARLLGEFSLRRFFSPRRILLAFAFGCSAHVVALFLQKFLGFPYQTLPVLACLAVAYALVFLAAKRTLDLRRLLGSAGEVRGSDRLEKILTALLVVLSLALGWEMTLRGRASSVNLIGDGYPHLVNLLGTLEDGPLPDALPFYSTFVANIHPMAFHALWADLKVLTPGLLHIDLFRYFSVLMVPVFFFCMMGFFSALTRERFLAALGAAATLFISGGGLSLKVPIVYFPWYWSIAWCLAAAVFYFLVQDQLRSKAVCAWAGFIFGVGVLMHPFFGFRMGVVMAFFLPLEILRRLAQRESLGNLWGSAGSFMLGAFFPVATWIGPLLLRYGWEPTYSYEYIVANFKAVAPDGVGYIQKFREVHFDLASLFQWSRGNAGLVPLVFSPLGIYAALRQRNSPTAALLLAWILGMAVAIVVHALPNRYRYFEYLFFAQAALAVYGLDFIARRLPARFLPLFYTFALGVFCFSIKADFVPKYRYALSVYGTTTELTEQGIQRAENRSQHYLSSKRAKDLDRNYGNYTGYLWSRQKKIWDIYVANQREKRSKAQ